MLTITIRNTFNKFYQTYQIDLKSDLVHYQSGTTFLGLLFHILWSLVSVLQRISPRVHQKLWVLSVFYTIKRLPFFSIERKAEFSKCLKLVLKNVVTMK